jgi:predicted deacetylase
MSARYLVRLDDASHHMDSYRWGRVEAVLDAHGVKPIVAVIPDNQDPKLRLQPRDEHFWDRVRSWAVKDWAIAMHGHTHVMRPTQAPLLLPFYARSEFAGLDLEQQAAKIRAAWKLFAEQNLAPRLWVAPAHSFDAITLQALIRETPIRTVSDGIAWNTYKEGEFHWIPQQLWELVERGSGVWTVCLHPNTMDSAAIEALELGLATRFRARVTSVGKLTLRDHGKAPLDHLYSAYFWWRWRRSTRRL